MFEKHKGKQSAQPESESNRRREDFSIGSQPARAAAVSSAMIGPGIHIIGEVSGEQDITIEGRVEGKIELAGNAVHIGDSGIVNADVTAKEVRVSGRMEGDVIGHERVVISKPADVRGNIRAPRVMLEDGAVFQGTIEMNPRDTGATELPLPGKQSAQTEDSERKEPSLALKGS